MADKIKKSYKFSKKFYDDALTQSKWWSRLYFRLLWGGTNDNEIARRVLDWIPDDFDGKLLDVPVGTAVFTADKYKRMTKAQITGLDYSTDMLERAQERLSEAGVSNVKLMQGDVGALPFADETFDTVLCMNGLHVFPDKSRVCRDQAHPEEGRRAAGLLLHRRAAQTRRLAGPHRYGPHGMVHTAL